jgi:hypothetical protein
MGFGKDGPQGQQGVVGPDGKVYPLNPPGDKTMGQHRAERQRQVANRRERNRNTDAAAGGHRGQSLPDRTEAFRQGEGPSEDQINRANAVRARLRHHLLQHRLLPHRLHMTMGKGLHIKMNSNEI